MVAMDSEAVRNRVALRGEGVRNKGANPEDAVALGKAIGFALRHADLTPQEAAHAMGYADESSLCRWLKGDPHDTPKMAKLLALPRFREGFALACARECPDVVVKTTIEIPDRRTA